MNTHSTKNKLNPFPFFQYSWVRLFLLGSGSIQIELGRTSIIWGIFVVFNIGWDFAREYDDQCFWIKGIAEKEEKLVKEKLTRIFGKVNI